MGGAGDLGTYGGSFVGNNAGAVNTVSDARTGNTTHGKLKGIKYVIKVL